MELYYMITVLDRDRKGDMEALYRRCNLSVILTMFGQGTATAENLSLYGLEATDKAVIGAVASAEDTYKLLKAAKREMRIDIPGNGIMLAIPIKSVGGGSTLSYLMNHKTSEGGMPHMKFDQELIVVILNEGYSDHVMEAARSAGASGGTVLHAKGTGAVRAENFFGVSFAEEKDVVYIVARAAKKADIMRAICEKSGPGTRAGAICFSLPISAIAGLRMLEEE